MAGGVSFTKKLIFFSISMYAMYTKYDLYVLCWWSWKIEWSLGFFLVWSGQSIKMDF